MHNAIMKNWLVLNDLDLKKIPREKELNKVNTESHRMEWVKKMKKWGMEHPL